jgi:hypothetical protein
MIYYEIESTNHKSLCYDGIEPLYIVRCVFSILWYHKTLRYETYHTEIDALKWIKSDAFNVYKNNSVDIRFSW